MSLKIAVLKVEDSLVTCAFGVFMGAVVLGNA